MKKRISWFMLGVTAVLLMGAALVPRITVRTDADGVLATPDTFWTANSNAIAAAIKSQGTNANLTALASNPQLYQATNATLTTLSGLTVVGSGAIVLSEDLGDQLVLVFQPLDSDLTALAANPSLYQATNANLTLLSAYGPTTWQATNSTLTSLSTNTITGTGTIVLSSVTDALATADDLDALEAIVAEIDIPTMLNNGSVGDLATDGTNSATSGFEYLVVVQPATYVTETLETLTPNIDFAGGYSHVYVVGTGDMSFSASNIPTDRQVMPVTTTNATASAISPSWSDWEWTSQVPITSIPANSVLEVVLVAYDGKITVSGEGAQTEQLATAQGGTGNTLGVARSPSWTVQSVDVSAATNHSVNLGQGTFQFISATDDVHLASTSGKAADATAMKWQEFAIENWSGNNHLLSWNADWNVTPAADGVVGTYTLSNSTITLAKLRNWGPNETNVALEIIGRTIIGAGSTPSSTLTDGLLAFWEFEDANTTTAADSANSYDLTPNNAAYFSAQQTGQDGYSWINAAGGTRGYLSRTYTDLACPTDGARTWAGWVYWGQSTISDYSVPFGHWNTSGTFGWFVYPFSSTLRLRYSTNSTTESVFNPGLNVSGNTWHFVVAVIDSGNKMLKLSLDGGTYETTTISAAVNSPEVSVSVYGYPANVNHSVYGKIDSLGVWNRVLTQSEVEELYDLDGAMPE